MSEQDLSGPFKPYTADWLAGSNGGFHGFETWLTAKQLQAHYEQNYYNYISSLNKFAKTTKPQIAKLSKTQAMRLGWQTEDQELFNSAAQAVNHEFFWQSILPTDMIQQTSPDTTTLKLLKSNFGDLEKFKLAFNSISKAHFASGWTWLVVDPNNNNKLEMFTTHDAYNPQIEGYIPLLTLDLWEHAYYLDYESHRLDYIKNFWSHVNWPEVEKRLLATQSQ